MAEAARLEDELPNMAESAAPWKKSYEDIGGEHYIINGDRALGAIEAKMQGHRDRLSYMRFLVNHLIDGDYELTECDLIHLEYAGDHQSNIALMRCEGLAVPGML